LVSEEHWPATRQSLLIELLDHVRTKRHPIDGVVAMRGGEVLFDCAFHPYRAGALHQIYSCTKTLVGILIGIAIDKGHIAHVAQPIADFLSPGQRERLDPAKRALTIEHFLTMTSGLDIDDHGGNFEGYFAMTRNADMLGNALARPLAAAPGERFRYNNAGSHVLCCVLKAATGETPLAFARRYLFAPMGIETVIWDADAQAGNTGWAGIALAPRDLAKVGQLYLRRGLWNGKRLVSEDWVRASTAGRVAAKPHGHYGYHWWCGPDRFEAVGLFGQYLVVVPEDDAVVAITSSLPPGEFLLPKYLMSRFVLPAIGAANETDPLTAARLRSAVARVGRDAADAPFVWRSAEEGQCRDGAFERTAAPAFRFAVPARAKRQDCTSKFQVAALSTFEGYPLFVSVRDVPRGMTGERAGLQFAAGLKSFGAAEQLEILSNRETALACGGTCWRTDIRYRFKGSTVCTAVVLSALSGGKWICLEGHTPGNPAEIAAILESFRFMSEAPLTTDVPRAG